MFVKNFYKSLGVYFASKTQDNGPYLVEQSGNARYRIFYYSTMNQVGLPFGYSTSTSNAGVAFGDGDKPVDIADYNISGNRITNLTVSYNNNVEYNDDGSVDMTVLYTITNNNTSAVTIKEVALFKSMYTSNNSTVVVMIDRTVLDSPVNIEAGGVGQVTYKISMNP